MRAFMIDDEKMYFKLLNQQLRNAGHVLGFATSGDEGLKTVAAFDPDVIILDIRLPDMNGFDVLDRLRADPHFSHIPVIFVTAHDELENKLKAFELGAEDYLTKPFKPEELVARLSILARRREVMKVVEDVTVTHHTEAATVIAIHSLRGGVGCTSLSLNLAIAYHKIWNKTAIAVDTVLTSGQVAMFLNASPKITWEDIADLPMAELDGLTLENLVSQHKSGIRYVAAPKLPIPFERFSDYLSGIITDIRSQNDFIVVDIPHDFSDVAIKVMDGADHILLVMAPEMGSLRAAVCALTTYDHLGYPPDKVKVVLNNTISEVGLKIPQVEKAIGRKIDVEIPYSPEVCQSINYGEPYMMNNPKLPVSMRVEELAYNLSQDILKNIPPAIPTEAWKRVSKRLNAK